MSTDETPPTPAFDPVCGWLKLWHKRGVQVTIPLRGEIETFAEQVDWLFDAGWAAECPGLEEGEEKESIGWVVRSGFERDGKVTPSLLLYAADENLTFSVLKVYLDTPEQVAAFEFASKLKLDAMPDYEGDNKPERGKSSKLDRYFVKAPKPFGVVFKKNKKYDESAKVVAAAKGEVYKVSRRVFVRWADTRPAEAEQPKDGKPDMAIVKSWEDWFEREDSNCAALNKRLPEVAKSTSKYDPWTRASVWTLIKSKAQIAGWHFSDVSHEFTPPNNQTFAGEPY